MYISAVANIVLIRLTAIIFTARCYAERECVILLWQVVCLYTVCLWRWGSWSHRLEYFENNPMPD